MDQLLILKIMSTLIAMVISYLLGSMNFAIIVTRMVTKKDIRDVGSGNAGMTNVLRSVGKIPALITLVGDLSKGIVAVWVSTLLVSMIAGQSDFFVASYLAAFSALLGHCFPVFYKFQGGKGVLVSAGALFALSPMAFFCCVVVFFTMIRRTKIVSIASMVAALMFPLSILGIALLQNQSNIWFRTIMGTLIAMVIIIMHRENIGRLLAKTEPKWGE